MTYTKIETTRENSAELGSMLLDAGYVVIDETVDATFFEKGTHRVTMIERGIGEAENIELMPWLTEEEYNN